MWLGVRFPCELMPDQLRRFVELPGLVWKNGSAFIPDHLLDPVKAVALQVGLPIIPFALSRPEITPIAIESIPLIRPWVPKFLTAYQCEGIDHSLRSWTQQSGMYVWATGSGKTIASQVWACAAGETSRTIVATKSAVRLQWCDQAERYTEATVVSLEGQKPSALPERGFAVIGYDVLPFWAGEIKRWKPHSLILDESHRVKSHKRWAVEMGNPGEDDAISFNLRDNQAAAAFIVSRAAKRRLATTATPIRDRVRDLWAQLDLIRPREFGPYFGPRDQRSGFAFRYCGAAPGQFGGIDDSQNTNMPELRQRLRYVAHYVPFSVANRELPPKRRIVTLVKTGDQNRPGAIAEDIRRAARSGQRSALVEARLWEAAARKRKRIGDLVEMALESKQKVIVFTGRRRDCDDLEEEIKGRCRKIGIDKEKLNLWVGHGGHSDTSRRAMQKDYMAAEGPAVLIGTSDAWGEGLDLQDTDLLLVAMLPVTPGQVIQLEGRVVRLGMKRAVLIQYLVAESTIDEKVAQMLLRKLPAIEKILDASEEIAGITRELQGADDVTLLADLAASILQASEIAS